ncbi:MAG: hypothetical protein NTZ17_03475 [Phycisphaerae bacterium]|nr:hypothetical protein [Phycisphaerae bacterium]
MKWFSERKQLKSVSTIIQVDSMSDELRNSLWNVLDMCLWSRRGYMSADFGPNIYQYSRALWFHYFKRPIDQIPDRSHYILKAIREYFFACKWYEVYDFLEFTAMCVAADVHSREIAISESLNSVLERELAGYRMIQMQVTPITDKQEVAMLEGALADTRYEGVTGHLGTALRLLSDRDSPDYRNSIKESISAVESMARIITGDEKATLGDALKELEKQGKLHSALKEGFSKLYGYTSDEGGIRHAMMREPNLAVADAKYFLLSCTSFVNYLKAKI